MEGKVFDNYAPTRDTARKVASGIGDKVLAEQARRLVVNLDDCPVSIEALTEQLNTWPIENLQEVIAVRQGTIQHIYP